MSRTSGWELSSTKEMQKGQGQKFLGSTPEKKVKKGGGETQKSHSLLKVIRKFFVMVKLQLLHHFDLEMR